MKMLKFAAGLAAGYVLGARAGRGRYQQIVEGARNLADQPVVAQAQSKVTKLLGSDDGTATEKAALSSGAGVSGTSPSGSTASAPATSTAPTTSTGSASKPPSQRTTTPPASTKSGGTP